MSDLNRSIKIYIDGTDAAKGIEDVKSKIKSLESTLSGLNKGEADYAAKSARLVKEIESKNKTLAKYDTKLKETERVLNNLSGSTYNELIAVQRNLREDLRKNIPGSEKYTHALEQNKRVSKQLLIAQRDMRTELGCQATAWGKAANFTNKYIALVAAAVTGITGFSLKLVKLAEDVAAMDDVYADVMKTTGSTRDEVVSMNEEFKKMNTRTSREELNKLASDAGKLSISGRKDILDFVDAGNQIRVALGEDLGEDAIKNIGKITDVYRNSTKEFGQMDLKGKMLSTASAINELGQSSTASEAYMVDFLKRLGGVASQSRISVQNILGYASALDQSGQNLEMSATAFQTFIMKLMEDPAKFAKLAGENVKEFTNLLNTDANEAIMRIMTSLNQKGGFQALIPVFKEMGMDGARAVGVLSSLADNINMVTTAQEISNEAFSTGVSITNEYSVKNNNLKAELEKAKNAFRDKALEIGEKLNPALLRSTNISTQLFKSILSLISITVKYKTEIILFSSVLAVVTTAMKLHNLWQIRNLDARKQTVIWQRIESAQVKIIIAGEYAMAAAKALLTGKIKLANTAMKSLYSTLGINPFVAIGIAVASLAVGMYKLCTRTTEAQEATNEFTKQSIIEQTELDKVFKALRKTTEGSTARKEIVDKINIQYKDYLPNLLTEYSNLNDIEIAYEAVNKKMKENIALKVFNDKTAEIQSESLIEKTDEIKDIRSKLSGLPQFQIENAISDIVRWSDKYVDSGKKVEIAWTDVINNLWAKYYNQSPFPNGLSSQIVDYVKVVYDAASKISEVKQGLSPFFPEDPKPDIVLPEITVTAKRITNNVTNPDEKTKGKKPDLYKLSKESEANRYAKELYDLKKNKAEKNMTEDMYNESLRNIEILHYNKLLSIAATYKSKLKNTDNERREEIIKDEITANTSLLEIQEKKDNDRLSSAKKNRDNELDILNTTEKNMKYILDMNLSNRTISQDQYDNEVMLLDVTFGEKRVSINKEYLDKITALDIGNNDKKTLAIKEAGNDILESEMSVGANRVKYQQKLQNLLGNFKGKFNLFTSADEIKFQKEAVEAAYNASIALLRQKKKESNDNTPIDDSELKKARNMAIDDIDLKYDQDKASVRSQYGLQSMKSEFQLKMRILKKQHETELLEDKEFEEAKLRLKVDYAMQVASYIMSLASQAVQSMQEAEIANVEAKYDVEIEAAKGNAEEVERLENEKAQKKLDIQKKYADVNFAIKVSEIIANTAVSIMEAFAQLGPIGGAIAAIFLAATGVTQIVSANAERQKVKNMTLNSSGGSSSSMPTGARVVNQQADGKYDVIGANDGRLYRNVPYAGVATTGIVTTPTLVGEQGDELVISAPHFRSLQRHINYPVVISAIQDVRNRRVSQRAGGKYDTLPSATSSPVSDNSDKYVAIIQEVCDLLRYLKINGITANSHWSITELEKKQKLKTASETPFTRK